MKMGLVEPLLALRKKGDLGSLGPAKFLPAHEFLEMAIEDAPLTPPRWDFDFAESYAIGDVHGDLLVLLAALRLLKLIDRKANWKGKKCLVVLCGDVLDSAGRGCSSALSTNEREEVDIIQYLHALRNEARMFGADVAVVLGNHEVARIQAWPGFEQYVSPEQARGWGGEKEMRQLFQNSMRTYLALHSPLFVRNRNFVFMHAGIPERALAFVRNQGVVYRDINQKMLDVLLGVLSTRSPWWTELLLPMLEAREFMNPGVATPQTEALCQAGLPERLQMFELDAQRGSFVVAHSVQRGFQPYCGGRVWRIDFAMSRAFCDSHQLKGIRIAQPTSSPPFVDVYECAGKPGQSTFTVRRFDINGQTLEWTRHVQG